jgi:hypothetical protein
MIKIDCQCSDHEGPCKRQAFLVCKRRGKTLALCSRCDVLGDVPILRLFDEKDIARLVELDGSGASETAKPFQDALDALGGVGECFRGYLDLPILES